MKAIYSCKLFKASTRKSKIEAAIADPLNLELVTQLKSYLDDEYQDIVNEHEAKEAQELADSLANNDPQVSNEGDSPTESHENSAGSTFAGPPGGGGSRPSLSEKFDMLLSEEDSGGGIDGESPDIADGDGDDISDTGELDEVEESTAINCVEDKSDVLSSSELVSSVKDLLASEPSTQGVNRVMFKKNELWIHYNDDINLNNVMGPVIEQLNSSGYDYMDFNRLARSENAIVFQVNRPTESLADMEDITDGQ